MSLSTISYNGWTSDPGRVWFSVDKIPLLGRTGRMNYMLERWTVQGSLGGSSIAEVDSKQLTLVNACTQPYGDLIFSMGTNLLLSADCVNGTQVKNFRWLSGIDPVRGSATQLLFRRDFIFHVEGMKLQTSDIDITEYHESFTGWGGGAIVKPARSLGGAPQAQQTTAQVEYWARQTGYSIGLTENPPASTALWFATPGVYYQLLESPVTLETPRRIGLNQSTEWVTRWNYLCWANFPLVATPSLPF